MAFSDFSEQRDPIQLLQRSLERGRLGHAYLFGGSDLLELEKVARTLAKAVNCQSPPRHNNAGLPLDSCDRCQSCRKIDSFNHPDISWIRPESKSRVITIEQMRDLMQTVHLKPTVAAFKFGMIVAADRLNVQAANAFLKTLEEPPPNSVLVLLSSEPQRILETILSRCLRLNFPGEAVHPAATVAWMSQFSELASAEQRSLLSRYQLLSVLLNRLNQVKSEISESLTKRSPLERYDDIEPNVREKWEEELAAAIEAEYRRQRTDLLSSVQWWLRDVWLASMRLGSDLLSFPQLAASVKKVAARVSPSDAMKNLKSLEETQRLLFTNVQEALVLEVGLLKLKL
ncbi:MAG TPA: DNA polymerase III subunit [Verrucomicrobiae bacterium]|nr:DNA polymerase III subunit [Verrucomicrobiae bacterium]